MEIIRGINTDIPTCIDYLKKEKENYVTIAPDLYTMSNVEVLINLIKNCIRDGIEIVEFVPCRPLDAMNSYEIELYHTIQRFNIKVDWECVLKK